MKTFTGPEHNPAMVAHMEELIAALGQRRVRKPSGTEPAPCDPQQPALLPSRATAQPGLHSSDIERSRTRLERAGDREPGAVVGRFMVLQRLGAGGMGVVYSAYDPKLDRKVALKLLRAGVAGDAGSARLLREAQALGKLAHPNVVAVHDVGNVDEQVWIAMELVQGHTLREWLTTPRGWREVLGVMREAGKGLAAAHAAGLLHRDFKPDNVMVGDDGRARVMDFGLARARPTETPIELEESLAVPTYDPLELLVTRTGAIVGTPRYMAPEQFDGVELTAAVDQFAFCVTLWESLFGERPFGGKTPGEIFVNVLAGNVPAPARTRAVPTWLRRVCERGMSVDPGQRWPSMTELLAELEEPPRRGRWVATAALTLLAGFGVGAMMFDALAEDRPCSDPAAALADAWGPTDRSAVESALAAVEMSSSLPRLSAQLDAYAASWVEMYEQSCRATFVLQQQSERMFDQRMQCLERRRNRLRSAIDALVTAETLQALVDRTVLPFKLPGLEPCADLEALAAERLLPDDDAQRQRVQQLRQQIDEADTLYDAGEYARGLEVAGAALGQARALEYQPVLAEALASFGRLQASGALFRDAQLTLEEAVLVAAQAGDDRTAAAAWTWLIYTLGLQNRLDEAFALELTARAAVERAHDQVAQGWLLNNLGVLIGMRGDPERAGEQLRRALEVKQRVLGHQHIDVGISWFNLGLTLADGHSHDEALEAFEHARSIFDATVGEQHPLAHYAVFGLCRVEHARGRPHAAVPLCREALAHFEASPLAQYWQSLAAYHLAQALWGTGAEREALDAGRRARSLSIDPELTREIEHWLSDPLSHRQRLRAIKDQPPR